MTATQTLHFIKPREHTSATDEAWSRQAIEDLFNLPFNDLMFKAQQIHRQHFNPNELQLSTLLSIKTGGCPEDCGYCPQSVHYDTGVEASKMLDVDAVKAAAVDAKQNGATRFCMGAVGRHHQHTPLPGTAGHLGACTQSGTERIQRRYCWHGTN